MNKNMLVLFAVLAFIIVAGCLSGLRSGGPVVISDSSNSKLSKSPEYAPSSQDSGTNEYAGKTVSIDRKIISTAQLQLEVDNVQTTFNKITNISLVQSGFVSGSSI